MAQPTYFKPLSSEFADLVPQRETYTTEIFAKKISEIKAEQIELIAMDLIFQIPPHLGAVAKANIDIKTIQRNGTGCHSFGWRESMMVMMQDTSLEQVVQQENPDFFSHTEFEDFTALMLPPITACIQKLFSIPLSFLDDGMSIQLSDYGPEKILSDVCKKMDVEITAADVPRKYHIQLNLNKEFSQELSTLVFVLIQKSNGVEFSKRIFTIEELEAEYVHSLNRLI